MTTGVIFSCCSCPQCDCITNKKEYYIEGGESLECEWCGYHHSKTLDFNVIEKGYGSIHYIKDDNENVILLRSELDINNKNKIIKEIIDNYDTSKSGFYYWNDKLNKLETLVGKDLDIDIYYDELSKQAQAQSEYESIIKNNEFSNKDSFVPF